MEVIESTARPATEAKRAEQIFQFPAGKVMHLSLAPGESIAEHSAPEHALVIVRSGRVNFTAGSDSRELTADTFVYLTPGERHSLEALAEADLVVVRVTA